MESWQFLIISLIVPLVMVVGGFYFRRGGPKKVNGWIGYRTPMSMKNQETWVFAHVRCGKLWIPVGAVLIILSVGAAALVGRGESLLAAFSIVIGAQLAALIISIVSTERALRKEFDETGERRQ